MTTADRLGSAVVVSVVRGCGNPALNGGATRSQGSPTLFGSSFGPPLSSFWPPPSSFRPPLRHSDRSGGISCSHRRTAQVWRPSFGQQEIPRQARDDGESVIPTGARRRSGGISCSRRHGPRCGGRASGNKRSLDKLGMTVGRHHGGEFGMTDGGVALVGSDRACSMRDAGPRPQTYSLREIRGGMHFATVQLARNSRITWARPSTTISTKRAPDSAVAAAGLSV